MSKTQGLSPRPSASAAHEALPEPPPDYDLQEGRVYEGLIPPHKIPNPVQESKDHKKLNQEIKFLAKRGANPLEQKPELQKELERRKMDKQRKESLEKQRQNRSSLEQKLDQQYDKLKSSEDEEQKARKKSELQMIQEKILLKSPRRSEDS